MMWAFLALAALELVVVHLVVALVNWRLALVLSAISLPGVIWVLSLLRSLRRRPIVLGEGRLLVRLGHLRSIHVPLGNIAGVRRHWESGALKAPGVANLALMTYPNLVIDLDPPLKPKRREIRAIAHKLDAPDAFLRALAEAQAGAKP